MKKTIDFKDFSKALVLGASGMIGSAISDYLSDKTLLLEAHRKSQNA